MFKSLFGKTKHIIKVTAGCVLTLLLLVFFNGYFSPLVANYLPQPLNNLVFPLPVLIITLVYFFLYTKISGGKGVLTFSILTLVLYLIIEDINKLYLIKAQIGNSVDNSYVLINQIWFLLNIVSIVILFSLFKSDGLLISKIISVVQNVFNRTVTFFSARIILFKHSSPKQRWEMVKIPTILLVLILLIYNIGPYFLPPRISISFPGNNSFEVPLDSNIEIIFDKGVWKQTAEKAFSITPEMKGNIRWEGDQKLIFTPGIKFQRAKKYAVNFKGIILSKFLTPLLGDKTINFETIGNPKVIVVSPKDEALEDATPITVIFDRPMIALTTATNSAIKKPAFTVSPQIEGEGRWLGTTAYQFRPSSPLKKGNSYVVNVPGGLISQDGGVSEKYEWQFSTQRPHIIAVSPSFDYDFASPVASVAAIFNQSIDPSSTDSRMEILDKNHKSISGRLQVSGSHLGFYPYEGLRRGDVYEAVVYKGVSGIDGPNGMEEDYSWSFKVADYPSVISTNPIGNSKGVYENYRASVNFKTPMDESSFKDNISIDPAPDGKPGLYFSSYDNTLSINSYFARSEKYTITIGANVKDQYGVALGKPYIFSFSTAPYLPSVSIYPNGTYFAAFNQKVTPRVVVQTTNSKQVNYVLYKLKREDFLDLYRRKYSNQCGGDNKCYNWQSYDPSGLEKVRTWNETFEADFNTPVQVVTKVTKADGSPLDSGFYYLDASISQGAHDNIVMIVSKSTMALKKSDKQMFSWVVDQSNGEVVSGMKMELIDMYGNSLISSGETNNDGVFVRDIDLFQKDNLFLIGQKNDDIVIASTQWGEGISRYDFGLPYYYSSSEMKNWNLKDEYKLFITLDRPIFRPSQKILFKGLVRKDSDGAYAEISPSEKVTVVIKDYQNRDIYNQSLPINSYGSFSDQYSLGKDAALGNYQIMASFGGKTYTQQFQVEEYKRPEVAVSVKPSKNHYLQGEKADVLINSSYYFGAAVSQAPTSWSVQTQDYSFRWDKDWRFEFGDPDSYWLRPWWYYSPGSSYGGEKLTEGKGKTDSKGDLSVSFPLDLSRKKTSQRMVVEAVVTDINNQAIAASSDFIIHKSGVYAGIHPASYANSAGKEAKVELVAVDVTGKELPKINIDVEFNKRTWESVREQNPDDGQFYYTSKPSDSLIEKKQATTDDLGYAITSFVPKEGGTYKIVARVVDSAGNTNTSGSFLWVSGMGFSTSRENNDRIVVVPDKQDYIVGDTMSLFVASPFASSSAKTLITAERGSVLDYKVVNTADDSNNFAISLKPAFSPNVFMSALLIKSGDQIKNPPEMKVGYTQVKVTDKAQQINLKVTTDKKKYRPRETIHAVFESTDALGYPMPVELAVALVDKSVLDLSNVILPEIYQFFYQPRNLEVSTSHLLTISMDRINANTNLGNKGGSGGGGSGGFDTSRRDFPETAFWQPHLKTDANGHLSLDIKLPDNLTTWRLLTSANNSSSAFGSKNTDLIVSRDILIRPFTPRFLSVGDESKLGAIVANTSDQQQEITAKIETQGLTVIDNRYQNKIIQPGEQVKLLWQTVAASTSSAQIKLTVEGNNSSFYDGVELTLPVKSYSIPETVAVSGQAKDIALENIKLPKETDLTKGHANISFSPSLGASSIRGINYLISYPYNCVEQATSKFIPAAMLYKIMQQAKLDNIGIVDVFTLKLMVNDGIQKLNNEQHADGGWGWWIEYGSDPFLTSYAFMGLTVAKDSGFTVSDKVLNNAQKYLEEKLAFDTKTQGLNEQAFILYVLKNRNNHLSSYASNLFARRFELSLEARAQLAIAMRSMSGFGSKSGKIISELTGMVKKSSTSAHWEESGNNYSYFGSNIVTTAAVLEALNLKDPKTPLITETIRYITLTQKDDGWKTTRDTAAVMKTILSILMQKGDQIINENYKMELNGNTLTEGRFQKEDLMLIRNLLINISDFGTDKNNKIQITRSGQGNLYYNINLKYFLPFAEIKPLEQGISVIREFVDDDGQVLDNKVLKEGSEVWERIILVSTTDLHYLAVEDILPAGLESVNESLKNVSVLNVQKPKSSNTDKEFWYFNHKEYRDDKTTFFASYLPRGVYELVYRVRATTPGRYHRMPAQAYEMYTPDVSGHSDGGWFEVK